MNKEVYLSNLEQTKVTYDNLCGVRGEIVFKDVMVYGEYQKLQEGFFILCDKDYIANLQQELKEANESVEWWTNRFKAIQKENENFRKLKERYQLEKEVYKSRIDKAIEYIIDHNPDISFKLKGLCAELINILKGDSNE